MSLREGIATTPATRGAGAHARGSLRGGCGKAAEQAAAPATPVAFEGETASIAQLPISEEKSEQVPIPQTTPRRNCTWRPDTTPACAEPVHHQAHGLPRLSAQILITSDPPIAI